MPGWLQFSLLDMTPYDRSSWLRLIENYQRDLMVLPWVSLLCTALLAYLLLRRPRNAARWALVLLAFAWLWCGAVFQMHYHASLNWAAAVFGWVFIVEALLLFLAAIFMKPSDFRATASFCGYLMLLLAALYPLLGLFEQRSFAELEWLAVMPAPTTLATLGVLMMLTTNWRCLLLVLPVLWLLLSGLFGWSLGLLEPYISGFALLALIASVVWPHVCAAKASPPNPS